MKMKIITLLLTSLVGFSQPANAEDIPKRSSFDSRIQYTHFNEHDVVLIKTAIGSATQIQLNNNEKIQEMASGDSEAWEIVEKGHNIYLKPITESANTNLLVTTNKRSYAFELKVLPRKSAHAYRVQFSYPDEIRAQQKQRAESQIIDIALSAQSNVLNQKYTMEMGSEANSIKPIQAFDDGRFTYVQFQKNKDMPVIYKVEHELETLINNHVQDDYIVLHGVFNEMAIRGNGKVIGLYNEAFDGGGKESDTGTISESVERVIKNAQ